MEPSQTAVPQQNAPIRAAEVLPASAKDSEDHKDLAALSYVWVLSLIVYATRRDSPFIRFHAKQGIMLFLLSIGAWFVPYAAKPLELVLLALGALGFAAAAQGQWKDLPLIGPMARGEWKTVWQSVRVFGKDLRKVLSMLRARIPHKSAKSAASPIPATPTVGTPAGQTSSASIPSQP